MEKTEEKQEIKLAPTYSQSRLSHYCKCPRAFYLSRHYPAKFGKTTQSLMDDGNLFEGYIFGFKNANTEEEIFKGKRKATIENKMATIKNHADIVRPLFEEGEAYKFIELGLIKEKAVVRGELDFFGRLNQEAFEDLTLSRHRLPKGRVIADLKYTGNIPRVWGAKSKKEDYLQALFYTWLVFLQTGEWLDFYYLVVESTYNRPLVKSIKVNVLPSDIKWLENLVRNAHNEVFFQAQPGEKNCIGGYNTGRCWYLEHCEYGRQQAGGFQNVNLSNLQTEYFEDYI